MKLAITGKGGVGKSTLSAAIAQHIADEREVIAIDGDPDMNLAGTLDIEQPAPITRETSLIEDRAGSSGGLLQMQPEVEDVLKDYSVPFGAAGRLVTIGPPEGGGTGCMCPENNFIRALVNQALDADDVIMDMEAGIEHLGRGTADDMDAMIVVIEPSRASIETAHQIQSLATDIGIDEIYGFLNKVRDEGEAELVREQADIPIIETFGYDEDVAAAGLQGTSPVEESEALRAVAVDVIDAISDAGP
ncbi:ArsA-related P-loop ATPase [Halapricum desulfuricans]|uniref:CO dehydrogenase maturation factor n=1 Tax=Halapricum desulfuricans TaxID=2841257 RepID=A0A897N1S7_9EURY|nr:ArsA-related P-loop ATPase [Halapricum desulfuricans]QSG06168.1 CO dehydrogenase maturation factor [Halapricum desulfuricans]